MGKVYLGNQEISPAVSVPVAKEKFGASIDTFIGDVNENGVLGVVTKPTSLVFGGVKDIGANACEYMFYRKTNINDAEFPALTMISGSGACTSMFHDCSNLTSVSFPALTTISGDSVCAKMFSLCKALTSISFPALTTIGSNAFGSASYNYIFNRCNALTEIHFRADAQATIEAMAGYADKWGAKNATIYFSL